MFRQDRTNPSSAVSNWKGRKDTPKAWVSTAVSTWLNGGLFGGGGEDFSAKAGYFMGGYDSAAESSIERFTFPDDTGSMMTTELTQKSRNGAGFSNDGVAGYNATGQGASSFQTQVLRIDFTSGVLSSLGSGLSTGSQGMSAVSNVATAAYVSLGDASNTYVTTVDKYTLPSESRSTLGTGLSSTRSYGSSYSNSGTAGYIFGGFSWSGGAYTYYATIDKFLYSNDSRSTLGASLGSDSKYSPGGMANSGTAGYSLGGGSTIGNRTDDVQKLTFSSDSIATLGTGLSAAAYYSAAMANSGVAGYDALSQTASGGVDTVNKFAFSDDSRSTLTMQVTRNLVPSAFANCAALSP